MSIAAAELTKLRSWRIIYHLQNVSDSQTLGTNKCGRTQNYKRKR